MRAAIQATGGDLGFAPDDIIPACLDPKIGAYNVDAIWAEIMEQMPEAQRAQLVRTLQDIDPRSGSVLRTLQLPASFEMPPAS